jgi:hypothetical protein
VLAEASVVEMTKGLFYIHKSPLYFARCTHSILLTVVLLFFVALMMSLFDLFGYMYIYIYTHVVHDILLHPWLV